MTEPKVTRAEHKELSEKKRAQARLSTAAGTLGLGAFGALAGSKALPKVGAGLARTGRNVNPEKWNKAAQKLGRGALETGTVSGGVGAASSLNFAALSRKESKKEEALAQGKNPNNPKIKKSIKRKYMNNSHALSKSLSDIAKSVAVDKDSPAWASARRDRGNDAWRNYVSPGAQQAHDESLAPARRRRDAYRGVGHAAFLGSGAGAVALSRAKKKRAIVPLTLASAAAAGGGVKAREKANEYDLPSRKIRARGFQRKMDAENLEKAFRLKVPGGFSRSSVVNVPGKKAYSRRGYLTRMGR